MAAAVVAVGIFFLVKHVKAKRHREHASTPAVSSSEDEEYYHRNTIEPPEYSLGYYDHTNTIGTFHDIGETRPHSASRGQDFATKPTAFPTHVIAVDNETW